MTPLNPCGAICDFLRRPYSVRCRPYRNSDREVTLKWYFANPDAVVLPFPTVFNSLLWAGNPWELSGPGEVYNAFRNSTTQRPAPGVSGQHQCGSAEDFAEGTVYDPALPPIVYNATGLPVCCNPPVIGQGGGAGGGIGTVGYTPPITGFGGGAGGGIGDVTYTPPIVGMGGGVGGGIGTVTYYPPGPTPGTDCVTAPPVPLGAPLAGTVTSGTTLWYAFTVTASTVYTATTTGFGGFTGAVLTGLQGTCPGPIIPVPISSTGGGNYNVSPTVTGTMWLLITIPTGSNPYTLTLT